MIMFYICTKFRENIPKGFRVIERTRFLLKFTKGLNSLNNVSEITVIVFCMLSDHV